MLLLCTYILKFHVRVHKYKLVLFFSIKVKNYKFLHSELFNKYINNYYFIKGKVENYKYMNSSIVLQLNKYNSQFILFKISLQ